MLCLDIASQVSAGGGWEDKAGRIFRSFKCVHILLVHHETNYLCTNLHSAAPDNVLMSDPNWDGSLELHSLWFGFTQHL